MSGPRSSRIEKCRLSLACPGVRSKAIGRPPKSVLRWILVEKPPRERPRAWPFCPLLGRRPTHAERRAAAGQRRPETFDFLGFTHYWTRSGRFVVKRKTQAKRMVRKLKAIRQDLLHRMHAPVREQHRWLGQILRGHYRYYGVIFNYRALRVFKDCVVRLWRKVLGKRSQKGR